MELVQQVSKCSCRTAIWTRMVPIALLMIIVLSTPVLGEGERGFYVICGDPVDTVPVGTALHEMFFTIRSTSEIADSVDVIIEGLLPLGWSANYCQESTGICYSMDARLPLPAGSDEGFRVDFYPRLDFPGTGSIILEFRSVLEPQMRGYCTITCSTLPSLPDVGLTVDCPPEVQTVTGPFGLSEFYVPIQSTGNDPDNLVVKLDKSEIPADWFAKFCLVSSGECFLDEATLPFSPGTDDEIRVDIDTGNDPGWADVRIHFYSESVPAFSRRCFFRVYDRGPETAGVPNVFNKELPLRITPNPMQVHAELSFYLETSGLVRADIFTPDGRKIRSLGGNVEPTGWSHLNWDGCDHMGRRAPAGVYLIKLETPTAISSAKILMAR
ncbi:MAG: hypothetical protein KJ970_06255 [Candidatus Eisenbacteria bacterium]|uniref:FlgD Ig-like domain-containing protein n=1 Tax=Eiseniibacteriota bacterium TaxID=2212470 RepID=A0A948RT35_UNCEI|nr:hypothetical protein [Candidatus Eisenbacteria bacterium]MBU1947230.1 hypothetical protein [Candidatus Eisenbacteria bacterium]MBU2690513.1 hypothetical protein [Candidatus Eisenbacteria bacterium]